MESDVTSLRYNADAQLIRDAGSRFDVIASVLDELEAGRPETAIAAVEKRREELGRASWSCIAALAVFHDYVSELGLQQPPTSG